MWFTPETIERLRNYVPGTVPQTATELQNQRAAEKAVNEAGRGVCVFCEEEIVKNDSLVAWESEFLLAYCPEGREHRHKPIVRYSVTEGIVNERNVTTDTEPIPDEGQRD